jgi:hypothetical protein
LPPGSDASDGEGIRWSEIFGGISKNYQLIQ